jgi:signal transduction histidine kinase
MTSLFVAQHAPVTRRIEQASGIRPMTLLIAFGIVLITAILIATGIAANQLRQQALTTTESELGRIDSVLAEVINRSFNVVDAQLGDIADRVRQASVADGTNLREAATAAQAGALLHGNIGRFPSLTAVALLAADGQVLDHSAAWPVVTVAGHDLVAALRAQPARASIIGAPIQDPQTGAFSIPLAHRIDGPQGAPVGAVVGMIPVADFTDLFAAVPLNQDAVIMLLGRDGTMLARFPEQAGSTGHIAKDAELDAVFGDVTAIMARHVSENDGGWRIEAWRSLADHRVAVAVSRNADRALAGWTRQGLWFGAFALAGALAIGVMVYLIARQFQTQAVLAEIHAEKAIAAINAEKNEMERARLTAEAELLKTERLSVLGQLTATVAHELRNPLSAIRNSLFTVKELAATAGFKLDRPVGRMERSIERCDRIISDLLEYTRNRELNPTSVCFDRWLAGVLAEQHVSPAVALTKELAAAEEAVPIDSDRMRRVIINLVENAAQALAERPSDHEKRIMVRTGAVDGELVLVIEDTGPGIPPENLTHIFEPLFSTKSFGTGLGLPTVRQIVNQHGGTIAVDSEVGRGTCVTVRLPLDAAAMEDVRVAA